MAKGNSQKNADGSALEIGGRFRADLQPDLKSDLVPVRQDLGNPPFNTGDWGGENLRHEVRWNFGMPPMNKADYAWIQHFIHHLSPAGVAGLVMAKTTRIPHYCSVKITQVRNCLAEQGIAEQGIAEQGIAEQGIAEEEALKKGMKGKSREFVENGAEVYAKA